jgi:hypothetical protein
MSSSRGRPASRVGEILGLEASFYLDDPSHFGQSFVIRLRATQTN